MIGARLVQGIGAASGEHDPRRYRKRRRCRLGGALGIAIFSAISTSRANHLLAAHTTAHHALTSGFQRALLACSIAMFAAAVLAARATNTRGEPVPTPPPEAVPLPEN